MWSKAANGLKKSSWLLILTTPSPAPPPHLQPLSQTIFDTFYPPNFCKAGLNDLKITETLLLYELYMMSRIMRRARILHLWHSSKKIWFWLFFFKSNVAPEDDVIAKIWWPFWCRNFHSYWANLILRAVKCDFFS